jgi:hypothetical protein
MFSTPVRSNTQREYKLDDCKNIKLLRNSRKSKYDDDFLIFEIEDLDYKDSTDKSVKIDAKEKEQFEELLEKSIFPRKLYFE